MPLWMSLWGWECGVRWESKLVPVRYPALSEKPKSHGPGLIPPNTGLLSPHSLPYRIFQTDERLECVKMNIEELLEERKHSFFYSRLEKSNFMVVGYTEST